jgi:hypothetical protein
MNTPLETMGGRGREFVGAHTISAYKWLAKSRNVSLSQVVEAAERGRLVDIVEMRSRPKISPGRPGAGARHGDDCVSWIKFRRYVDW